jgi:seryl-tRNA synthetase
MHDLRLLREGVDLLRDGMARRGALEQIAPVLNRAVELDVERRSLIQAAEERKAARNEATQEVARLRRAGGDATEVMDRSRLLGDEIARLERELADAEGALNAMLLEIPNITLPDVPAGGEDQNTIVREWGTPRRGDGLRPHWEIGESLGILDLPRGAKITGSGFVVFRGKGARLVRSFMNFMLDLHTGSHGYEEVWVPFVANRASMTATTQLPKFEEDMYALRDEPLFLVPTAEVPVTNLYRDEILTEAELPKAFSAYTPCFRREAGSHGKDTRGLLRVHEFDKVELVRYTTPESSAEELEHLLAHAEKVVQSLGLAYRVKLLAAGDTGFASAKTYDIEAWAPGVGQWLEISSCSTFVDFQARRGNIRYRPAGGGKPRLVHTLNGSALAFARTIACVLETHQRADGTVEVPVALRTYLGTDSLS